MYLSSEEMQWLGGTHLGVVNIKVMKPWSMMVCIEIKYMVRREGLDLGCETG